ncbi:MAG: VWA domain-containing protein, partial [Rubrivivax sp.]|nr:VWA domain-containing protein [Pyrinomonadaceae bacterium]
DKMSRVKTALLAMLPRLREEDTLSIVVFDCAAEVLMPARKLTDRASVERLVRNIEPGSCTNIHAGLMLGYREALKSYSRDATNRVVLLTDGIANEGVTDPKKIASESLSYNDRGVDLSTIGVGFDLNQDLLRELAKSGRGLFHFVADAQDIEKVFIKELQSLISPVATNPVVEIDYGAGLELAQVYGYEPRRGERGLSIKLDNMNNGLTQVVMLRFRMARGRETGTRLPVTVRFTYYDLEKKRLVTLTQVESLTLKGSAAGDMLSDEEVGKNYTIALLAQSIRDMAAAWESQRYREAEDALTAAIAKTYRRYPALEDKDIERTLMTVQKYQEVVKKINQPRDAHSGVLRLRRDAGRRFGRVRSPKRRPVRYTR